MSATMDTMKSKSERLPLASWVILIILTVAGIATWIYQLIQGIHVTSLNAQIVWGLYIAGFFTVAGAGAGLLALVGFSEYRDLLPKSVHMRLLAAALAAFVTSGVLILVDITAPGALWRLITAFRFNTPETMDFWALAFSVVVAFLYFLVNRQSGESTGSKRVLAVLGIIGAFALVVVESLMLSQLAARPMWSGLTIFSFLLSAFIGGLSLAVILLPVEARSKIMGWLATGLWISLILVFAEVLAGLMSGNPRANEEVLSLLVGTASPFFWTHVIFGLLLPLFLVTNASTKSMAGLIGGLALLGVLANKLWLLVAGQEKPWLDFPSGSYFPNWVEFVTMIGALAVGGLIYFLLLNLFQAKEVRGETVEKAV